MKSLLSFGLGSGGSLQINYRREREKGQAFRVDGSDICITRKEKESDEVEECRKIEKIEKEIAALKKEQLSIKKYLQENIKSDEELIKIVSKLRDDIADD